MLRIIITGFVLVTFTTGVGLPLLLVRIFDRAGILEGIVARWWSKSILLAAGIRLNVIGQENVSEQKSYLFMCNHESALDIPAVIGGIKKQLRMMAKKELYRIPLFGWLLWAGGHIRIDRSDRKKAIESMDSGARRIIKQGVSIVIFPEGTRSIDGEMKPFKKGGFMLALKHGFSIVPVTIIGSRKLLPKKSLKIKSGVITVVIGKPIDVKDWSIDTRDDLVGRVRGEIKETRDKYSVSNIPHIL